MKMREREERVRREVEKRKKKVEKDKEKGKKEKKNEVLYKFRPKINQKLYNCQSKFIFFAQKILVII